MAQWMNIDWNNSFVNRQLFDHKKGKHLIFLEDYPLWQPRPCTPTKPLSTIYSLWEGE